MKTAHLGVEIPEYRYLGKNEAFSRYCHYKLYRLAAKLKISEF